MPRRCAICGGCIVGERARVADVLERELCERINAGEADGGPWRAQVWDYLHATLADRLAIDNPRFDTARPADRDPD